MVILDAFYNDDEYAEYSGSRYGPDQYMLAHSGGVEYAKSLGALDFSVVDPFSVWMVFAGFGNRQACIARVRPLSITIPDTSYAFGVNRFGSLGYVDGAAFVPGVIRAQLTAYADEGEYDIYGWLPCVTVEAVEVSTSSDAGVTSAQVISH